MRTKTDHPATVAAGPFEGNHTLAIIDPTTLQIMARAPVGRDCHEVVASADEKLPMYQSTGGAIIRIR